MTMLGLFGFVFLVWCALGFISAWFEGTPAPPANPPRSRVRTARLVIYALAMVVDVWCLWFGGHLLALPK